MDRLKIFWSGLDPETQKFIFFAILIVVGILATYGAIKVLIYFYKLNWKEKISQTIITIFSAGILYLISQFIFGEWGTPIFFGFAVLFLISIVFGDPKLENKKKSK